MLILLSPPLQLILSVHLLEGNVDGNVSVDIVEQTLLVVVLDLLDMCDKVQKLFSQLLGRHCVLLPTVTPGVNYIVTETSIPISELFFFVF